MHANLLTSTIWKSSLAGKPGSIIARSVISECHKLVLEFDHKTPLELTDVLFLGMDLDITLCCGSKRVSSEGTGLSKDKNFVAEQYGATWNLIQTSYEVC